MENVTLVAVSKKSLLEKKRMAAMERVEPSLRTKFISAGLAACFADLITFPLDTAKVRLQVQGEGNGVVQAAARGGSIKSLASEGAKQLKYRGVFGTLSTISREEGCRALYNGLVPGLQRQMAFASIRIGLYDATKHNYMQLFSSMGLSNQGVGLRILAGVTTGAAAVLCAQPTDVVKVRMQAAVKGASRYRGTMHAYTTIARTEGLKGMWKGTSPNVLRNGVVNSCELVSYDLIKEQVLKRKLLTDNLPCHFVCATGAGFITTVVASPVDVIKTRFMNSPPDTYRGVADCAYKMASAEGPKAFYKGFMPSFMRLGSWNIVMFVSYEQLKRAFSGQNAIVSDALQKRVEINKSGPSRYM